MATAFAQNELINAQLRDEDAFFKIGSLRRNSDKFSDCPPMTRRGSVPSLRRKTAQDLPQKEPGLKVNVLVKNDELFNEFKSDLSSTGSCTGAGAKAILHNFISQKMDDTHGVLQSSSPVSINFDAAGSRSDGIRRRMSGISDKVQRRLSMASLASSLGLDDECVSSDPLQASGHSNASSQVLVEFDHSVRRRSSIAYRRNSRQMQRQQSSSSDLSDLSDMASAARVVAAEVDLSDDEKEIPRSERNKPFSGTAQSRRSSIASGGVSFLGCVVSEEKEGQPCDDENSIDDYISDTSSTSDESLYTSAENLALGD